MINKSTYSATTTVERNFLFGVIIVLFAAIAYPMWLGHSLSDDEKVFTGAVGMYADETFYYLALGPAEMADGQKLLGEDKFMRADGDLFINPIGNVIAFLAGSFDLSHTDAFLVFRLFAAVMLVLSFYLLTTLFIKSSLARIFACVLYLFGAGYDGCLDNLGCSWALSAPEMNMFVAMIGEYYIPLANALFILYMFFLIQFLRTGRKILLPTLGLMMLLQGAVYIYGMLMALIISLLVVLYQYLKDRQLDAWLGFLVSFLGGFPIILYYAWLFLFHMDDAARNDGWISGPGLAEILLTYLWVFLPAMFFPVVLWRLDKAEWARYAPLLIWFIVTLALTLIPPPFLPFQVQAHIGIAAPLCIMAIGAVSKVTTLLCPVRLNAITFSALSVLLLSMALRPNFSFYDSMLSRIEDRTYPEFTHSEEWNALQWIAEHVPQDAAFAVVEERARMLASVTGCRVFYRSTPFKELSETKKVLRFWSDEIGKGKTDCPSALVEHKVSHIFVNPLFRKKYLQSNDMYIIPCSKCIYSSGEVSVWQLNQVNQLQSGFSYRPEY